MLYNLFQALIEGGLDLDGDGEVDGPEFLQEMVRGHLTGLGIEAEPGSEEAIEQYRMKAIEAVNQGWYKAANNRFYSLAPMSGGRSRMMFDRLLAAGTNPQEAYEEVINHGVEKYGKKAMDLAHSGDVEGAKKLIGGG